MGRLANGALCVSTPKHNGKSGTVQPDDELMCSGRVNSPCFTSCTRCVTLVKNQVLNHEIGHLLHRYSVPFNQATMATVKPSKL